MGNVLFLPRHFYLHLVKFQCDREFQCRHPRTSHAAHTPTHATAHTRRSRARKLPTQHQSHSQQCTAMTTATAATVRTRSADVCLMNVDNYSVQSTTLRTHIVCLRLRLYALCCLTPIVRQHVTAEQHCVRERIFRILFLFFLLVSNDSIVNVLRTESSIIVSGEKLTDTMYILGLRIGFFFHSRKVMC